MVTGETVGMNTSVNYMINVLQKRDRKYHPFVKIFMDCTVENPAMRATINKLFGEFKKIQG